MIKTNGIGLSTFKEFKASASENPQQGTLAKIAASVKSKFASIRTTFANLFQTETAREKHDRIQQKNKLHEEHAQRAQKTKIEEKKQKEADSNARKIHEIGRFGKELNCITRAWENFQDWQYARNLKEVHWGCKERIYTTDLKTGKNTLL